MSHHPAVPIDFSGDEREHTRKLALAINRVLQGQLNNFETVTLTTSSATTVISDPLASAISKIWLFPTTANAAAALATTYKSAAAAGSITLTHANNAQADRTFDYILFS